MTTTHAAAYERIDTGYTVTCRCGWDHDAPVKAGALQWYRQHKLNPTARCPVAPRRTCSRHGGHDEQPHRCGTTASGRPVYGLPPATPRPVEQRADWAALIAAGCQA